MGLEILAKARMTVITTEGTDTSPATTQLAAA
jgi:putative transposase